MPKAKAKKKKQAQTYAKTIVELCNKLGIVRQNYYNHKDMEEAPKRSVKGYPIEAWREFLESIGTVTNPKGGSLRDELTKRDIILRDLLIQERKKDLIDRTQHDTELQQLASIFKAELESLATRLNAKLKNPEVEREAQRVSKEILESVIEAIQDLD